MSYYAYLMLVDFEVAGEPQNTEIIEFSWMLFDVEQRRIVDRAFNYVRPEFIEVSDAKLEEMGISMNVLECGGTLSEAVQKFDNLVFSTCQNVRKPVILATFGRQKLCKDLQYDAKRKDITLFAHYNHFIDIRPLIRDFFPSLKGDYLCSLRQAALKIGVPNVSPRESGLDGCQTLAGIIVKLLEKGLHFQKEHSQIVEGDYSSQPPRAQYPIIRLRGLPWDVTDQQLIMFVEPVTRVSPKDVHICVGFDGRATGEAFIHLASLIDRDNAIRDLHGRLLGQRWIEVFRATEDEFQKTLSNRKALHGGCTAIGESVVKLRGLPWSCNEYEIVKFFKDGGFDIRVDDIVMGHTPDGRLSGDSWVEMDAPDVAEAARQALHKKYMGKRFVEVFPSTKEEMIKARKPQREKEKESDRENGPIRNHHWGRSSHHPPNNAGCSGSHTPNEGLPTWGFNVLRLRGMPFHANEQHIVQFFSGYHMVAILPSTIPFDGRPSGEAYVQFIDSNEAWRAYQNRNGCMMDRRYIELFPASKSEMDYAANGGDPKSFRDRSRPY